MPLSRSSCLHPTDPDAYFNRVEDAHLLQNRFRKEANVDIVGRVRDLVEQTTGLCTRIAREGERNYFAGNLRVVDNSVQIHADYGPYVGFSLLKSIFMLNHTSSIGWP